LETSEELGIDQHGYFGVAYYKLNKATHTAEIVIAHRGTCFDKAGNVLADLKIMEKEKAEILEQAAFLYAERIHHKYSHIMVNNRGVEARIPVTKVTHVGFSLGGYIAAACAVLSNPVNSFAVTFDAPGCDYLGDFDEQISMRVINYVTTPNLVNTANTHVGAVRRLSSFPEVNEKGYKYKNTPLKLEVINLDTFQQLLSTLESHCLEKIITDTESLGVFRYEEVYKWPTANNTVIYKEQKRKDYYYFPEGDPVVNFAYGLFQIFTSVASDTLWEMTKKQTDNGEVGLVAVEHERNDLIFYNRQAYEAHLSSNLSSYQSKLS